MIEEMIYEKVDEQLTIWQKIADDGDVPGETNVNKSFIRGFKAGLARAKKEIENILT